MKRFLASLLCVMLAATIVFTLAACNVGENVKAQLIDSLIAESKGEIPGYKMNLTASIGGTKELEIAARGTRNPSAEVNADMVVCEAVHDGSDKPIEYSTTGIILRNNNIFMVEEPFCTDTVENVDIFDLCKQFMDKNPTNFMVPEMDPSIGDAYVSIDDLVGLIVGNGSYAELDVLSDTLAKNLLDIVFNEAKQTKDGYVMSIDLEKLVKSFWKKIYAVAKTIDEDNQMTVKQLYADKSMQNLISPFLKDISGKQLKAVIDMLAEISDAEMPFELPTAVDESAVEYIAKVLDSATLDGTNVTISSLKVSELFSGNPSNPLFVMPDLTDALDEKKDDLFTQLKDTAEDFDVKIHFDSSKVMTKMEMKLVTKTETPDENNHLWDVVYNLDYTVLTSAPQLWDTTNYVIEEKKYTASEKINFCSDTLFYVDEYYSSQTGEYEYEYFTASDENVSIADIYAFDNGTVSVTLWAKTGVGYDQFIVLDVNTNSDADDLEMWHRCYLQYVNHYSTKCSAVKKEVGNNVVEYIITYRMTDYRAAGVPTVFELVVTVTETTELTHIR